MKLDAFRWILDLQLPPVSGSGATSSTDQAQPSGSNKTSSTGQLQASGISLKHSEISELVNRHKGKTVNLGLSSFLTGFTKLLDFK